MPLRHERALPFIQALLLYPPSFLIPANNSGVRSYSAWVSGDSAVDNLSCVFLSSLLRINAVEGGIKVLCDTLWVTWGAFPPAQGLLLFYIHPCSCLSTNLLCTFFLKPKSDHIAPPLNTLLKSQTLASSMRACRIYYHPHPITFLISSPAGLTLLQPQRSPCCP